MAKFKTEGRLALSAQQVYDLMTSPEHQQTVAKQFKATRADARREEGAKGPIITMEIEEPSRDDSDTEKATMRFDWDQSTRSCTWSRRDHQRGDSVRVGGTMRLSEDGPNACHVVEEGEIEIKIPFIGGMMASKIASSIERKRGAVYRFWEELGKR
jgi:hypothetical protein